jgi:uncharacterized protein (DUF1684 family)
MASIAPSWLDLYDWRRRVDELYRARHRAIVKGEDPRLVLERFRAGKDALFGKHPQSPIAPEARSSFPGLRYFAYDPELRIDGTLSPITSESRIEAPASGPHPMPLQRAGTIDFRLGGEPGRLTVFWIDVYGGGLFLPFRDATCPAESYGAGRYLFDTVKGSSLDAGAMDGESNGYAGGPVTLDFNYAYNPSCAYDARWACPLAAPENWLTAPIRAGELKFRED